MEIYSTDKVLTNEAINDISTEIAAAYVSQKKNKKESETKVRLSVEELLLSFRDTYGEEKPCRVIYSKLFRRDRIEISMEGEKKVWAPYDEDLQVSYEILVRLGVYRFADFVYGLPDT